MSYFIEWNNSNIIVTFDGKVKSSSIIEIDSLIYSDKRYDSMEYQLFDFTNITEFIIEDYDDAEVIAQLDKSSSIWNNNIKLAVVTTNDDVIKMTNEYATHMLATNWEIKIFENRANAEDWCKN